MWFWFNIIIVIILSQLEVLLCPNFPPVSAPSGIFQYASSLM